MHTTTVDLLRHGACDGGEIFRGSTDVALSDTGWEQMRAAIAGIEGWTRIVSSDLQRCQQFATALAEEQALPLQLESELREIYFGDWEGKTRDEVRRDHPDAWREFWRRPGDAAAPNGESIPDFRRRIEPCMQRLLDEHEGEHLLVISHGTAIRTIMCRWLGMPLSSITRLSIPYASLTRFRWYHMEGREPWVQLCFHRGE